MPNEPTPDGTPRENEKEETVIYVRREKIAVLNEVVYEICVGLRKHADGKTYVTEIAVLAAPSTDFPNAAKRALELSSKTGWIDIGGIDAYIGQPWFIFEKKIEAE